MNLRENCSKTWTFFFWTWLKESNLFLNVTQNLKILGWKIVKTLNSFQKIMTQRIELFSQKNDAKFFLKKIWFEEWNLLENMTFKQKHDSNNWTLFTLSRRTFFFKDSKNWTFLQIWLKELNFFCLVWVKEWVFS